MLGEYQKVTHKSGSYMNSGDLSYLQKDAISNLIEVGEEKQDYLADQQVQIQQKINDILDPCELPSAQIYQQETGKLMRRQVMTDQQKELQFQFKIRNEGQSFYGPSDGRASMSKLVQVNRSHQVLPQLKQPQLSINEQLSAFRTIEKEEEDQSALDNQQESNQDFPLLPTQSDSNVSRDSKYNFISQKKNSTPQLSYQHIRLKNFLKSKEEEQMIELVKGTGFFKITNNQQEQEQLNYREQMQQQQQNSFKNDYYNQQLKFLEKLQNDDHTFQSKKKQDTFDKKFFNLLQFNEDETQAQKLEEQQRKLNHFPSENDIFQDSNDVQDYMIHQQSIVHKYQLSDPNISSKYKIVVENQQSNKNKRNERVPVFFSQNNKEQDNLQKFYSQNKKTIQNNVNQTHDFVNQNKTKINNNNNTSHSQNQLNSQITIKQLPKPPDLSIVQNKQYSEILDKIMANNLHDKFVQTLENEKSLQTDFMYLENANVNKKESLTLIPKFQKKKILSEYSFFQQNVEETIMNTSQNYIKTNKIELSEDIDVLNPLFIQQSNTVFRQDYRGGKENNIIYVKNEQTENPRSVTKSSSLDTSRLLGNQKQINEQQFERMQFSIENYNNINPKNSSIQSKNQILIRNFIKKLTPKQHKKMNKLVSFINQSSSKTYLKSATQMFPES